jgi:hypothetical protein
MKKPSPTRLALAATLVILATPAFAQAGLGPFVGGGPVWVGTREQCFYVPNITSKQFEAGQLCAGINPATQKEWAPGDRDENGDIFSRFDGREWWCTGYPVNCAPVK